MSNRIRIGHLRRNALVYVMVGNFLQAMNVILGLIAVLLTLTVSSKPFGTTVNYELLGYFAAVATAALTFVRAETRGKDWSRAGRHLEDVIARYDGEPTYPYADVVRARDEAVKIAAGEA
ncbi:hypothetical protein LJR225_005099 [Phenylobacterium sp. LjRoot225]|uniref:hypothetical protein n=1 Tax=Phenylobacterium sp. LjRoot225 TaxID=3342285 RepID=UPI003ECEAA48